MDSIYNLIGENCQCLPVGLPEEYQQAFFDDTDMIDATVYCEMLTEMLYFQAFVSCAVNGSIYQIPLKIKDSNH